MKKKTIIACVLGLLGLVSLVILNNISSSSTENDSVNTESPYSREATTSDTKSNKSSSSELTNNQNSKSNNFTIGDTEFYYSNSVRNDVTGNWRISLIASSQDITEYALDYYKTVFISDDEIHAIVNFSLNTTACISIVYDGMLDVSIHEYVDGEEHDAELLFSGTLLKEYWINIETGKIEEII